MEPIIRRRSSLVAVVVLLLALVIVNVSGNLVFSVNHKLKGREGGSTLSEFKAHDDRRHARILAAASASENAVDVALGGNGHPSETG